MVPLCNIAIQLVSRRLLPISKKHCPKVGIFLPLMHNLKLCTGPFVLLEILTVALGIVQIGLNVTVRDISSLPDIKRSFWSLYDEHCSWIKFFWLFTLIKVVHEDSSSDLIGVFWLVRRNQENSWTNWNVVDAVAKESFVPPDKLGHEGHVRVGDLSSFSDVFEAIIKSNLLREDHITKNHCGRSWNALDTMHIHSSSLFFCSFYESDDFIEATFNVFTDVIF